MVNVYIKPYNSSKSKEVISGQDLLLKIEEIINDIQQKGEVILCGDFNARTAQLLDMVTCDSNKFIPMPEDYLSDEYIPRCSQDISTNPYCTPFLNMIKHNQLKILNGRTLGDLKGNFTSIQQQGCSVIDYVAVSKQIQSHINYLKIQELTEYSDHKPLSMQLRFRHIIPNQFKPLESSYEPAPARFIFSEENNTSFSESQKTEASQKILLSLNECITSIENLKVDEDKKLIFQSVNDLNNKFTEHIHNLSSSSFKKTKNNTKKNKSNNPWFNWQARQAKKELRKATKVTSEFPSSDFLRENFYRIKGGYKKLLSKNKTNYFENLNKDIEDGKILNWHSFKKLKKHKSSKHNFDSFDMDKFENFYRNLYEDKHKTVSKKVKITTSALLTKSMIAQSPRKS